MLHLFDFVANYRPNYCLLTFLSQQSYHASLGTYCRSFVCVAYFYTVYFFNLTERIARMNENLVNAVVWHTAHAHYTHAYDMSIRVRLIFIVKCFVAAFDSVLSSPAKYVWRTFVLAKNIISFGAYRNSKTQGNAKILLN